MLSKSQTKYIRSLAEQKYRKENNAYVVEGEKLAKEWLSSSATIRMVVGLSGWIETHEALLGRHPEAKVIPVPERLLASVSTLKTANQVLLVADLPLATEALPTTEWCIALDTIQDPGNLGTIMRVADWFGIGHVVCSFNCADAFNPKVVQAGMGAHLRVRTHKTDINTFLSDAEIPVIAATLSGENIYQARPFPEAVLLIGNESKGLSSDLLALASHTVRIPGRGNAESLNAAISAGILCALLTPQGS